MERVRVFNLQHCKDQETQQVAKEMDEWLATNPGRITRALQSSSGAQYGESSRTVITIFYEPKQ